MRNSFGFFAALLIFVLILSISGCERSGSGASKASQVTSKVTTDSKLMEEQNNFCKNQYEHFSNHFLQSLYRFEGNLSQVAESKIKRLQFVEKEWEDFKKNEAYRNNLWSTEMYPDPEYWRWKIQIRTKNLIKKIENTLDWPRDRNELLRYLRHIREEKNYSESEKLLADWQKREALIKITEKVNLLDELVEWVREVEDIQATLSRLGDGDRLDKALGSQDKKNRWKTFSILSVQADGFRYIINCQIEFLGRF